MIDAPAPALRAGHEPCTGQTSSLPRVRAVVVLVAVTAVWGVTFVQVKEAIALYPLLAFLALRFAIAGCPLATPALPRLRTLGARGLRAGVLAGSLLGAGYVLQTAGLQRTSVSSAGFVTGLQVVLTPLLALALFRVRTGVLSWIGIAVATVGLGLLSGVHAGSAVGNLLVPHGWTVWGALVVTGVFASALGFLAQTWAQRRATATQTALAYAVEPVWTAFFGFTLVGDRLGPVAWLGCVLIMAGVSIAEPVAA